MMHAVPSGETIVFKSMIALNLMNFWGKVFLLSQVSAFERVVNKGIRLDQGY